MGNYQTFEGKNINHAGINVKPAFVGILEALGLGDKINVDDYGGYKPGSIKGTFTDGFKNPFTGLFQKQATIQQINDANKKAWDDLQKQKELEAKKKLEAELNAINTLGPDNPLIGNIDHTGGGGDVHSAVTRAPGSKGPKGTPTHSTRDDLMASGGRVGLASMFTRRR